MTWADCDRLDCLCKSLRQTFFCPDIDWLEGKKNKRVNWLPPILHPTQCYSSREVRVLQLQVCTVGLWLLMFLVKRGRLCFVAPLPAVGTFSKAVQTVWFMPISLKGQTEVGVFVILPSPFFFFFLSFCCLYSCSWAAFISLYLPGIIWVPHSGQHCL